MTDERLKQLMQQCGMPNSRSVKQVLEQASRESYMEGQTAGVEALRAAASQAIAGFQTLSQATEWIQTVRLDFWGQSAVVAPPEPAPEPAAVPAMDTAALLSCARRTGFNHRAARLHTNIYCAQLQPELHAEWTKGWQEADKIMRK